ncbi:MAG: hypothetical protein NUW37_11460 [Planctomycetes bacterium]|nr:hypothetical protein [Planctomycetota bacterium]
MANNYTVTNNSYGVLNYPNASLNITKPTRTFHALTLCVTGNVTKPSPGATATLAGDAFLNAIRSVVVLCNGQVLHQWAPRDFFWVSAVLWQRGTSEYFAPDVNDTSGPTTFEFSFCIQIPLDVPGHMLEGYGGLYGCESLQIDIIWGELIDIFTSDVTGWTLTSRKAGVWSIETGRPMKNGMLKTSVISNLQPVTVAGEQPVWKNANRIGDLNAIALVVRNSAGFRSDLILTYLRMMGYNNEEYLNAFAGVVRQMNAAQFGQFITGPMALTFPEGLYVKGFTTNGILGAPSITLNNGVDVSGTTDDTGNVSFQSIMYLT